MPLNLRYSLLSVLLLISVSYEIPPTVQRIRQMKEPSAFAEPPLSVRGAPLKIRTVRPEAEKAGLKTGDEVLELNGRVPTGFRVVNEVMGALRPGGVLHVKASRDGKILDVAVPVVADADEDVGKIGGILLRGLLGVVMPWLCLATGYWVAFRRPMDNLAWLLLWLMLSTSKLIGFGAYVDWGAFRPLANLYAAVLNTTWPISMMLFGIYFPERYILDRRYPWAKWIVLGIGSVIGAYSVVAGMLTEESFAMGAALTDPLIPFRTPLSIFVLAQVAVFFMALGHKRYYAKGDARRRLRVLTWGTNVAMAPLLLLILYGLATRSSLDRVNPWVLVPALLFVFLFPLTIAYVIVVERAMDAQVVLRQSLQYALARKGVRVVQALLVMLVAFTGSSLIDESANRPRKITVVAGAVAFLFLSDRAARRLSGWIDRRFFRDAYNAEQVLSALSDDVRGMVETRPLLETVAHRIAASLHVERLAFLLDGGGKLVPVHAVGYQATPDVEFAPSSATARHLLKARAPLSVYPDQRDNWVRHDDVDDDERGRLASLDAQLLLPLAVKDRLLGFISLGPKRSEEPYSPNDVHLLRSVAVQTGLALENSRLTEAIASEVAQRERLNRELEIAREVQERFFPQSLPPVPGLDYAGVCRPARGVGGDYYDFLALPQGHLGIAVGDVSGKGIPAALLMASLQASLRGQAINGTSDLASLMTNVNKLVYDASPSNRYATFFYAQFDPAARRLIYVNGGHNNPLLLRGDRVLALETGGPIVGLFPRAAYEQGEVVLEPGDTLLLFTDGVSEAMNLADEEFGEDRLIATARACEHLPAQEMLPRVFAACDAFADGAPQHDDMTMVVMKAL